jgi:hypothetical protein
MAAKAKRKSSARSKGKRTTHRSTAGTKLYGERSASGEFEDVQTFERAHERDIKLRSKAEQARKKSKKKSKKKAKNRPKKK